MELLDLWRDGESHSLQEAEMHARRIWGVDYYKERFLEEMRAAIVGSELSLDAEYRTLPFFRATPVFLPYRRRFNRSYKLQLAVAWLRFVMRTPRLAAEVRRIAGEAGIKPTTLKVAKAYLKIASIKRGGNYGGDPHWWWVMTDWRN